MSDTDALNTRHDFDEACYGGKGIAAIFTVGAPSAVKIRATGVRHAAWWP